MKSNRLVLLVIFALLGYVIFISSSKQGQIESTTKNTTTKTGQNKKSTASYGEWRSELSAASIFEASDYISQLSIANDQLYFVESRSSLNGNNVIVKLSDNHKAEIVTPDNINVRSRVHEYGGRPYLIDNGAVYYSNFKDQKIYKRVADKDEIAITQDGYRYMHCVKDTKHEQLICVREDHRTLGEPLNTLVAIQLSENGLETVLFGETDFVSSPQISPDGNSVAFISWSHPNMPWDDTQLRILTLSDNGMKQSVQEVPQQGNVAFRSPQYSTNGTLYFVADFHNWWTLYRLDELGKVQKVIDKPIEMSGFDFENNNTAIISYKQGGIAHIARANLATGDLVNIGEEFSTAGSVVSGSNASYFIASTTTSTAAIYKLEANQYNKIYQPSRKEIAPSLVSLPQAITYATGNNEKAFGFYYPPKNNNFMAPVGHLPPLIVKVHGGPVGATNSGLKPKIQFWTSRGFAVFDVNHRGSTGYGREFRKKLYPNWGVVDIEDVVSGVKWLTSQALIDADKIAIRGGSAGGYTTLAALAFKDIFKAGTSYFGISDLEVLAQDTHKFESRYLDQLIGPYPEMKYLYEKRSPIYSVKNITAPLLLIQGLDDKVVPPNQSEMIYDALRENCIATAYITYEGEGHGFRQPKNLINSLNAELDFYGQIFGFKPDGITNPIELVRCE